MRMFRGISLLAMLLLSALPIFAQSFGDVVFTEVMYDDVEGGDNEWVEIHNTTGSPIDISNWVVGDASTYPGPGTEGYFTIPNGTTINAGEFLVLCRVDLAEITGEILCVGTGSWILGNTGDNLTLHTAQTGGTLIDGSLTVTFPDLTASNAGNSIQKCNVNTTWPTDPADWNESTTEFSTTGRYRHCTPGLPNTPCAGDVTPPALVSLTVVSNTQLDLLFDEAVNQTVAETEANYSVNNGVGAPTSAIRDAGNTSLVHLTFTTMPVNSYTLTIVTVQDLSGNSASNLTANFALSNINPNDVVITELMYDDATASEHEWIEILNTTGSTIDLSGWIITDDDVYPPAGEGALYIPAGTMINPGQYLVLSDSILTEIPGAILCPDSVGGFAIANGGDNLAIYTALTGGAFVHGSLVTFYPDLAGANVGNSIEICLGDVGMAWDDVEWYESTTVFAETGRYINCSPGAAPQICIPDVTPPVLTGATVVTNSQIDAVFDEDLTPATAQTATNYSVDNGVGNPTSAALQPDGSTVRLTFSSSLLANTYNLTVNNVTDLAGNAVASNSMAQFTIEPSEFDLIITEIMPNPNFVQNDDSLGEWFEIYNRGANAVNMNGWIISDNNGSDTLEGNPTVAAGDYFVFCSNGDLGVNAGVPTDYDYHYGTTGWGLGLNNSGETITLRDGSNITVTSVNYAGLPFAAGASSQLSATNLDPSNPANWCVASSGWVGATNGDFGTPGAANICGAPEQPDTLTICEIRLHDICGNPVENDSLLVTYGIVTYNDSCRRNMYVESNGCALLVFGTAAQTNLIGNTRKALPGDSVRIEGRLDFFAGVTEFSQFALQAVTVTFLSEGNPVPAPVNVQANAISQLAAACVPEQYESEHLTVMNVRFDTTGGVDTFEVNTNYRLFDGNDTIQFRVNSCDTLIGQPIPLGPLNVTGILAQYDTSGACYCQDYQLLTGEFAPFSSAQCGTPVALTSLRLSGINTVQLRWQTADENSCGCYNVWYSTLSNPQFPNDFVLLTVAPINATSYDDDVLGGTDVKRTYVVTGVPCP